MNKEEAIQILKYQLNMKNTDVYTPINYQAIEKILQALENSILKEVIEEKIKELDYMLEDETMKKARENLKIYTASEHMQLEKRDLQELLEGK